MQTRACRRCCNRFAVLPPVQNHMATAERYYRRRATWIATSARYSHVLARGYKTNEDIRKFYADSERQVQMLQTLLRNNDVAGRLTKKQQSSGKGMESTSIQGSRKEVYSRYVRDDEPFSRVNLVHGPRPHMVVSKTTNVSRTSSGWEIGLHRYSAWPWRSAPASRPRRLVRQL
jgi:hypothetical protein